MSITIKEKIAGLKDNSNASLGFDDLVARDCLGSQLPSGEAISVLHDREALYFDLETREQLHARIGSVTVSRDVPCHKVTTSGGRSVIVGGDWSLIAYNSHTGKLDYVSPENAKDKLVPVIKKRKVTGTFYTWEHGWFYGALISDGWLRNNMVGYAKVCREKREFFERVARTQIHENFICKTYHENTAVGKNKLGDSAKIHLNGVDLARRIVNCVDETLPYEGRNALRKFIPPEILYDGSWEFLLGLLAGLLEGDGTLGWNYVMKNPRAIIRYSTSSPRLVEDFRVLGILMGFRVSVTVTPPRGHSKTAYSICLSIPDMYVLFYELKFVSQKAQEFKSAFIGLRKPKNDRDVVPVIASEAKEAADYLPKNRNAPKEILTAYAAFRDAMHTGFLSRDAARKYLNYLPDTICPRLRKLVDNDSIIWERYKKVEVVAPGDVYNLRLYGSEICALENGLIVPV